MIRLIACDLDGTLVDADRRIPAGNREAVAAARAAGARFVLCSNRPPRSLRPYWAELGLTEPVVAYGGALLWDMAAGRAIWEAPMPPREWAVAVAVARRLIPGAVLTVEAMDRWWTDRLDPGWWTAVGAVTRQRPEAEGPVEEAAAGLPAHKLLLLGSGQDGARLAAALAPGLRVLRGRGGLIEVTSAQASKSAAVARLTGPEDVLAIGDDIPDVDLLIWAGDSAAPADAVPEALRAARRIVVSSAEGAVAAAWAGRGRPDGQLLDRA